MANLLKEDLTDKVVRTRMTGAHFRCVSGAGCLPRAEGTRIFGTWLDNDENAFISSHDICEMVVEGANYSAGTSA